MSVLAWIGIIFIIIALQEITRMTILDITDPYRPRVESPSYATTFLLFGVILSSIGGLVGRPRFIWQVLVVSGVIYCILRIINSIVNIYYFQYSRDVVDILLIMVPGIVCIIVGLIIFKMRKK
jgi:hypothetical protein